MIADGMYATADRLALDYRMSDEREVLLLAALPEGEFVLKLKLLSERNEGDWVSEDK